ncbi:HNH endonuclease signature motif containing protein, partial [Escherichia coli]|uniref:HNH endonuclease signature motif containing protein n=1 Tax=Escherichia coli TaxID=562 RepID=UPI0039F693B6
MIRLIWELRNGPIDEGLVVRHKCDNRKCCNPEHLELGTRADNMNDRFIRGGYSMYPSVESVVSLRRIGFT